MLNMMKRVTNNNIHTVTLLLVSTLYTQWKNYCCVLKPYYNKITNTHQLLQKFHSPYSVHSQAYLVQ